MITMSIQLRIILIVGAVVTMISMLRKIRKKKVQIDSTIFWILFSFVLVVIAVFPDIIYFFSKLLGVRSPANLVVAGIILILIIKMFPAGKGQGACPERLPEGREERGSYERKRRAGGIRNDYNCDWRSRIYRKQLCLL